MLSIGEFARLVGVSVRMLRHYDRLGLLEPARVDEYTGYRSYSTAQLDRANRLVALKDLGFSLDQVGHLLADGASEGEVLALLRQRSDELTHQLRADARRLAQVQARIRLIAKEIPMSTYHETALPALTLAARSVRITDMTSFETEMGPLFDSVGSALTASGVHPVGPGVALYAPDRDAMIASAAEPIGDAPTPAGLEEVTVEAVDRALTTQYVAPDLEGIQAAWQGLVSEVERRGLTAQGTCREVYLSTPFDGEGWVVDLQQPIG
ncbi:MerR family transcriptional regulator [Propioniciclava sinopodophylli]|uniref:MerR family transcriptional regulator n=1 Tax=Propioniciclava sinopodophylli TaxID=1837344 RepID=A0A4Q9KHZ1_9ACTN|nr:helix-turn-helix domain-containing protein [Propioniciclava sinopodophylli]TBT88692.1 MerR family transcriptional regulator [Propioniciclava sinopodophylli]